MMNAPAGTTSRRPHAAGQTGLAAALWLAAAATAAAPQPSDMITVAGGAPLRGRVVQVSPVEVTIQTQQGERKAPANKIVKISWAEEPAALRRARDLALAGRWNEAAEALAQLQLDAALRPEIRQDVLFYRAWCASRLALEGEGDKLAAAQQLREFIEQASQSFHYYRALRLFAELAYAVGRYDTAAAYYERLAQAPWPTTRLEAVVLQARSLAAQGTHQDALRLYETALQTAGELGEDDQIRRIGLEAQLGKARCLAQMGRPEEGVQLCEQVIGAMETEDPSVLAHAYNALGACHEAAGRPKDALLAYLHVDLLYFQDADAHAEALHHLAQLWTALNQPDRAVEARNVLVTRYPDSPWAKQP